MLPDFGLGFNAVGAHISLPPTLDRVRWEILFSFAGGRAGVAGRRMKFHRRFIANRTVRANLILAYTLSLAFLACLVEATGQIVDGDSILQSLAERPDRVGVADMVSQAPP